MQSASDNVYETIVVGGGLVGAALALGIARRGQRVAVIDGDDRDFRPSRGNFGLVWVQGKGADFAPYARWSGLAARRWPEFAETLQAETGIDIELEQNGGYEFCFDQAEWDMLEQEMTRVRQHTDGEFEYQMLDNVELKQRIPQISDEVLGASYSSQDGHVNPLLLLRALHQQMQQIGCHYLPRRPVQSIVPQNEGFVVNCERERYRCDRIVLCAGLDNQRLAQSLGMNVPVEPLRGQLLITERIPRFLPCALSQLRQTRDGTLQIGASHDDVGFDDSTTLDTITRLASRAVRVFPHLSRVRLVRAWGALRVMTTDGYPIYHQAPEHPGAYAVSCHSGVTLASLHSGPVADWICGDSPHPLISNFSAARFDVSTARQ